MDTVLYTSVLDNRFGSAKITSRVGLSEESLTFDRELDIFSDIMNRLTDKVACVMIDEAQFLTKDQVSQICRVVDHLDVPVLTYGLRSDFRGEPFEGSMYLLLWADELVELKTICHCGKKATMNARFDSNGNILRDGEQIDIGGRYVSLCRKHYMAGQCSGGEQ
jgi:thymidine kinase